MKLTILIILTACLHISAATMGQNITVNENNATLKNVLAKIEKQSGYTFFYDAELISNVPKISLSLKDYNLEKALDLCFKDLPIKYTIVQSIIILKAKAPEPINIKNSNTLIKKPDVHVQGTVSDKKGLLAGVIVSLKSNDKIATVTNTQGAFSITVPTDGVLVFKFLGYKTQEVPVNGQTTINTLLIESNADLKEVVVTALGIKKSKEMISYATQTVQGADLTVAPETNVAANLVGKVAGLEVNTKSTMYESPEVYLRGAPALVVIDGAPTDRTTFNFWSLDPNAIESITVLKGTAAAALYGSDGINGAIMINTKKGKDGGNGTEVTFNSSNQLEGGFLRLPKTQTQYGMGWNGYYAFTDGNGGGGWYDNYGYVWGPKLNQKDPKTVSGYQEVPQYNSPYNPNVLYNFTQNGYPGQSNYQPLPLITRGNNNLANFLNKEFTTTNNISVASKTDKTDFRISLTDMHQNGQVPNTELNSTTLTLTGSVKATDKLKISAILSYNYQNSPNYPADATNSSAGSGSGPGNYFYDILLWMGPDVNIRDLKNYWLPSGPNPRGGAAYGTQNLQQFTYNYSWYNNPYFVAYQDINKYSNTVIQSQLNAEYSFTKDLSLLIRSTLSSNSAMSSNDEPYSFIDNSFKTQIQGDYSMEQDNNLQVVTDALLTYKKSFLKDFHATLSAGATTRYNNSTELTAGTVGGLTVPNYYNLAASAGGPSTSANQQREKQSSGLFGYADVDYKSLVYLGVTGRNDWVSDLPKPNNSYFYPSANLGMVVSNMVKLPEPISYFKLRASWAQISDDLFNISSAPYYSNPYKEWYASLPTYTNATRWNGTPSLSLPGTLVSPNLQPNKTVSQEYGTEMSFFKNRLGLDFTYFTYDQTNQINQVPISSTSGYDYQLVNGGNTTRKGLEAQLRFAAIRTGSFKWDVTANWDKSHTYQGAYYGGATTENGIAVGERADAIIEKTFETDGHGNVVYDKNGNPVVTPYAVNLGNSDPNWEFGITNTFSYKNFTLKISVDGRIGGKIYDGVQSQLYIAGNDPAEVNSYRDDAYLGKNTYPEGGVVVTGGVVTYNPLNGKIFSDTRTFAPNTNKVNYINWVTAYHNYSSGFYSPADVYSRTFVKLREVILSYNIDSKLIHKTPFKSANVSLTGRNLLLWTKVPDIDPDGYNGFAISEPSYRSFGLNLNFKF